MVLPTTSLGRQVCSLNRLYGSKFSSYSAQFLSPQFHPVMLIPDRGNVVGAGVSSQRSWQDSRQHPSVMERVTAFRNTGALLGCDDRSWAAPGYWGLGLSIGEPAKAKPLCYPLQHHCKKAIWREARAFPTTVLFPLLPAVSFSLVRQRATTSDLWCTLTPVPNCLPMAKRLLTPHYFKHTITLSSVLPSTSPSPFPKLSTLL